MGQKWVVIADQEPGWRRWRGPLAALLIVASLVLWWVRSAAPPASPPSPPSSTAPADEPALQPWHTVLLGMADPQGEPAMVAEPGVVQLCDVGRVELDASGALPAPLRADARSTLRRMIERQAGTAGELTRARGVYLQLRQVERENAERRIAAQPGCAQNDRCREAAYADRSDDQHTNELARLAAGTRDPAVYALAYYACRGFAGGLAPTSCATLSAAHWAQLDPDNGVPLLFAAAEADAQRDTVARDEIVSRIARARRLDPGNRGWMDLMANGGFAHQPRTSQVLMLHELLDLTAVARPPYFVVMHQCTPERVRDPQRRETCSQLAELLTTENATTMERQIGTAIAARVGWPAERLSTLRAETAAVQAVSATVGQRDATFGCEAVERAIPWLLDSWAWGELPAARTRIQASGRSLDEWAEDGRQWQQARVRGAYPASARAVPAVGAP